MSIQAMKLNEYIDKIVVLKRNTAINYLAIGAMLKEIKETNIYEERYDTFEEFLASPEVSFSRATAFRAMKVYEVFGDDKKIYDIDTDKLYKITSVVNDKNKDEWLSKAETLTRSDLWYEVRKARGLPAHEPEKGIVGIVKEFLYSYCKEEKIEPDKLELEELLTIYEKWRRSYER